MSRAPGVNEGVTLPQPSAQYDAANERETRRLLMQALRRLTDLSAITGLPASLTALGALVGVADNVPYFSGVSTMALASLTPYARTLIACATAAAARTALGLGTVAVLNTDGIAAHALKGDGTFAAVNGADLSLTDVTTNDVTTARHGFAPKAPNDVTKFLRGDATWAVPAGGSSTNPLNTPMNLGKLTTIFPRIGSSDSFMTTVGDGGSTTIGTAGGSGGSNGIGVTATGQSGFCQTAVGYQFVYNPLYKTSVSINSTPINLRMWLGFSDQAGATLAGTGAPAGNLVAFRFDTSLGDTHWMCVTKDGTTQTVVDSGVAPAANTKTDFAIDCDSDAGSAKFYIAGVLVATITTHLPTSTTSMRWVMLGNVLSGSYQIIYFGGSILLRKL